MKQTNWGLRIGLVLIVITASLFVYSIFFDKTNRWPEVNSTDSGIEDK